MTKTKTLEDAVVRMIVDIETMLTCNLRAPEVVEYRRGFQEALTGLKNSEAMSEVIDALREKGWQPPIKYWVPPSQKVKDEPDSQ